MNNNILQLNRILPLSIGLFVFSLFLFPYITKARRVDIEYRTHPTQIVDFSEVSNVWKGQDVEGNAIETDVEGNGIKTGDVFYVNINKEFNLTNSSGNLEDGGTVVSGTSIESTSSINYLTSSYSRIGADNGTPEFNTATWVGPASVYFKAHQGWHAETSEIYTYGALSDYTSYTLTSDNESAISCSGTVCTAVGNGTANILVTWSGYGFYSVSREAVTFTSYDGFCRIWNWTPISSEGDYVPGPASIDPCHHLNPNREPITATNDFPIGSGEGYIYPYNLSYTITSTIPDNLPTINDIQAVSVGYNDAKITWNYSDVDGDAQTWWNTQISTTPSFNTNDIVIWSGEYGVGNSSDTSIDLKPFNRSQLVPNTKYYTRVLVGNSKANSGWVNGPEFTTPNNPPQDLDQLSCDGVSTGYTSGKVNWKYTGTDEPGDILVFKLRYKKTTELGWSPTVNLPTDKTGAQDIANLISGYGYNVEISLNDNRNAHLGDRWKQCGEFPPITFTTTAYPEPSVDFNLKSGSTTVAKGGTLTIKTGDPISTNWKITNPDGITPPDGLNSCALSTTGVRDIFRENNIGFESSRQNNNVAADTSDQTYTINLSCTGKDARVPKSVNANITLVIQSYPLISCRIVNNKVVSTESPTAQVEGTINNANPQYKWEIKRYAGDTYTTPITNGNAIQNFTLDYTGLEFGKYKPVIRANGLGSRTSEEECGENISNFGTRSFQEVAK